jgi:XTP/dITP diphosphohydrolase
VSERVVLASANLDKVAEIFSILAPVLGPELVLESRPESVPPVDEDGETLEDNARKKAVAVATATGAIAVADDTGLEVEALGGAPGVLSSRYAGEDATYVDNVLKLLDALAEVPEPEERIARFRTVALARFPDGNEIVTEGTVDGTISLGPRGSRGFGYDPVFVPDEGDGRTFAEMTAEEKNALSHRGRAFRALAEALGEALRPSADPSGT